jgi:hypothetical protein
MKKAGYFSMVVLGAVLITGCTKEEQMGPSQGSIDVTNQEKAKKEPAIWADCEAFATILTPTSFSPNQGNFDELYTGANFKDGLMSISESKPGDQDYNGGRWHVNMLMEGVDPNKYINACSVEELDLADFVSTDTYFECPLLPIRGNSGQ